MAGQFERQERLRLHDALASNGDPPCPRCGGPLDRTEIQPRTDVSYVKRRVWLRCASCDRSLIVDYPKVAEWTSANR